MKTINDFWSNMKGFLEKGFNKIKRTASKELEELEKVEDQLKKLRKSEKGTDNAGFFDGKSMFKFWIIGLLVVFLGYIAFQSLQIIYLIITAYILSVAIEAVIDFFERIRFRRGLAIAVSYFLLIIILLSGLVFIVPFLFSQISEIIKIFIGHVNDIQTLLQTKPLSEVVMSLSWIPGYAKDSIINFLSNPDLVGSAQMKIQENLSQLAQIGTTSAQVIGAWAVNFVGLFFNLIGQIAIILTLSVLFSIEKNSVIRFISSIGSLKSREYMVVRLERIYKKLGIWLKSQLLLCIFIGVAVYVALWLLSIFGMDLPQKGTLALIAGLTEFIPYLGPLFASVAAILVALLHHGIYGGIVVLIIFFIIQWLENNVFIPFLMNKTLGVNPIVIFVSMIIGGLVMGFLGVLLAVPIAVIITLMLEKD
ncbi:AI-2E family transporter [Candidatus Gracilibacteria bacterium]|nr:AI-2E family transporter [Candidatus Gracilibacteria bacterium]